MPVQAVKRSSRALCDYKHNQTYNIQVKQTNLGRKPLVKQKKQLEVKLRDPKELSPYHRITLSVKRPVPVTLLEELANPIIFAILMILIIGTIVLICS